MPRTITVTLPEGYEDATHLIVIGTDGTSQPHAIVPKMPTQRAAYVLRVEGDTTVAVNDGDGEIGVGPLNRLVIDAAHLIRADFDPAREVANRR